MADKELTPLQKEFRQFFSDLLDKFGVKSPADLDDEKKAQFFDAIAKYWENGKGPKKDPDEIKVGNESLEESKVNESPVGQVGRTSRAEAIDFITENPEKVREIRKLIKQAGGKTVFFAVLDVLFDNKFDDKNFEVKPDEVERIKLKKIQGLLQGEFV